MPDYHFFAMLSRMKYINRWGLMRNTHTENISEHSLEVAIISHALAVIHNKRFQGSVNEERAALLGLFHDASEIITGDMPTPVKYHDDIIRAAYRDVEAAARNRLMNMLPDDLQETYRPILQPQGGEDQDLWKIVKAADKLSAYMKCIEEEKAGNGEFLNAKNTILEGIHAMQMPEVDCFLAEFLPSYTKTLDQISE